MCGDFGYMDKLNKEDIDLIQIGVMGTLNTGITAKFPDKHYPVELIVDAVLEITNMERRELEDGQYGIVGFATNGWQWDWWQSFKCGDKNYTLSGSGYYGGHTFSLDDED